jgi:hypothetical protein
LLVVYHAGFTYTQTVFHYLDCLRQYSRHKVDYFNVDQAYDNETDFSSYDAVFVNYCVVSVGRINPPDLFMKLVPLLHKFAGTVIVSVQDEYDFTDNVKVFLMRVGADVVLTCIPKDSVRKIYFEPEFENVRFETVLTGYISEDLLKGDYADDVRPLADRDIPLGYRGRQLPYRIGDMGWHKAEIGKRFKQLCQARKVACDIDITEESRFHGGAWLHFVRRCRVMLGVPSGASVFDFDGSLHKQMKSRHKRNNDFTYAEVRKEVMSHAVDFDMGQVSARVFEAAVSRTALAMLRGSYSNVLEPDEHYVPIEPDYSNIESVLDRILDVDAMQAMADRTYDYVIRNSDNHYMGFVNRIDGVIDQEAKPSKVALRYSPLRVTKAPLGNDPYMVEKMMDLRKDLEAHLNQMSEFMRVAAEKRLEVVKHHDGTLRVLKFDNPQLPN